MKALKKWFPLISLVAGVLALVMIFHTAVKFEMMGEAENYNGLTAAFGNKDKGFDFSILLTLAYVLPVAGGVLAFLGAKKGNKIMAYVAIACFVVGAIFLFCAVNFTQLAGVSGAIEKETKKLFDLGIGAILAAIFSLLGAVAVVLDTFVVKE